MAGIFTRGRGGKRSEWERADRLPARMEAILALLRDRRPLQEVCVAILAAGVELLDAPKDLAFVRYCDCTTGATRRIITIDNAYADSVLADTLRGITGRALRTGKPQLVGDVRKDRDYVVLADQARSELAVPLLLGGACYGVLNFESPKRDAFAAGQVPLVQMLAQLAALADRLDVERGVHDSELLRGGTREADSAYLRDLDGTLDRVIATLGGAPDLMAEAMMIVPHSQQLVTLRLRPNSSIAMHIRLRAGEGIAGRALQIGQPFSGDTQLDSPEKRGRPIGEITHLHNTRAALAVPLRAKDDTIVGLLNVESPHAGAFGQDALDALTASGLLAELANRLAPLQRETLTPETVADDLLDTLEQQIAFAIDPDDLAGTYYQILQVAARTVSAPEVSAGLILVRDEALNLVPARPGEQGSSDWAVRASRLGVFDSDLEWRLDGTSIARRVMDSGETANVGDVRKDPDYRDSGTGYDQSSELIAALPNDHHAVGVIGLVCPKLDAFSETDQHNLERVARIAVVAIKRAEDILSARRSREQLDAVGELLRMLHPLFPADASHLRAVDVESIRRQVYARILELGTSKTGSEHGAIVLAEKTETGTPSLAIKQETSSRHLPGTQPRWAISEGVTGQAYRTGRTVNIAEVSAAKSGADFVPYFAGARSELAVPMKRGGTIVGVLDIESGRPHHFTTAQIQWAEFLAEQAAFALAAVDLVTKSKIELEFSDLSQRIDQALVEMRTLAEGQIRPKRDELLHEVLAQTCRITGSSIGRVLLAMNAYPFGEAPPGQPGDTLDVEHGQFLRMISTETSEGRDAEERYFPITSGVASIVLRERRTVFFNDLDSRPEKFFTHTGKTILSGMFVPILEGVRVAGVLDIESEQVDAFTDEGITAGQRASELVSKLIVNTRLHLRSLERKLLRTFETRILLNRSSDAKRFMGEALGYAAQLADIRSGWGRIVEAHRGVDGAAWEADRTYSMAYAKGVNGPIEVTEENHAPIIYAAFQQALDTRAPVLVLDTEKLQTASQRAGMPWPARSLICVPLLQPVEDDNAPGASSASSASSASGAQAPAMEAAGVLAVASPHPSEFSEADKEVLTLFAQTIISGLKSIALLGERAELMREVRHDFSRADTPLTFALKTVRLPVRRIQEATSIEAARQEAKGLENQIDSIHDLVTLIKDLMNLFFDLSNDELAPEPNVKTVIAVKDVVGPLEKSIDALAAFSSKSVRWVLSPQPLVVVGGKNRVKMIQAVLFKYLDNAIKYSSDPTITVTVAASNDQVELAVSSVGPEVPREERSRLFQLHYRGTNVAPGPGSYGIGLYQAKQIAHQLHGSVAYEIPQPNQNSFILRIPEASYGVTEGRVRS